MSSPAPTSHMQNSRPLSRRYPSSHSRGSSYDESPYPADMPPGPEARSRTSGVPIQSLSKEEIRDREALINKFEAEEELIINRLSRRMDELKASTARLSNTLEAESESIVNRLNRQLRVVQAQLEVANRAGAGDGDEERVAGRRVQEGDDGGRMLPRPSAQAVGMQTFMTGSDPIMMGSVIQQLHEDKTLMQKQIDTLSGDNDALRQELIGLRQRLGIPVDDLIGLGTRTPGPNNGRNARHQGPNNPSSRASPIPTSAHEPNPTQPIPFMRRPAQNNAHRSVSPPLRASVSTSTTTSSSSTSSAADVLGYSESFPPTDPSSHRTDMTSPSESPYAFSPASLPPVPHNTYVGAGTSMGPSSHGRGVAVGTGGMPLPYPSVPPPSLANSLASTSALASTRTSPTRARRSGIRPPSLVSEDGIVHSSPAVKDHPELYPQPAPVSAPSPAEFHLLYVLLDSNLPTGGFVASSGLESYAKHGLLAPTIGYKSTTKRTQEAVLKFVDESLINYASGTIAFVMDAWRALDRLSKRGSDGLATQEDEIIQDLFDLDALYEAMTLNHVTRRSSTAQGIALLTLYSKSLAPSQEYSQKNTESGGSDAERETASNKGQVVERFKKMIRKGETHGHLPVCWGMLTCASGLRLDRAIHLYLFLHARSLLSSAVRLNLIGPYLSTQILLQPVQPLIEKQVQLHVHASTGLHGLSAAKGDVKGHTFDGGNGVPFSERDALWAWAEDDVVFGGDRAIPFLGRGPAMTWPLGELVMGRHDLQHTRIFNS